MQIPTQLLQQLYTFGSLENNQAGIRFSVKNRLSRASLVGLSNIKLNGEVIPHHHISVDFGAGKMLSTEQISRETAIDFPLSQSLDIWVSASPLPTGSHTIEMTIETEPFGTLQLSVQDTISIQNKAHPPIPRNQANDFTPEIIEARQAYAEAFSGTQFNHVQAYSFDAPQVASNCEHFVGVAQVPLGIAGPLKVDGEYAQGDFLIPLATSEGTLVASYNRGIKLLNLSGGAVCTISADAMQRAPVFVFETARQARDFTYWVEEHFQEIRRKAEATSNIATLHHIEPYLASKFAYLRFNYTTGDAAGQNMVGRATLAACRWILRHYPQAIQNFYLESNLATDKKASQINTLRTRGKRVSAEVVIKREDLAQHLRVTPEMMHHHATIGNVGAMLAGANNNGLHSANALAALFIATGQDVANVAESSTGIVYTEITAKGDLYLSLTIPSLIVATYGGGTGLPTQRECLEMMTCYGQGQVNKLAEIIAGVALAGEISLAAAISSSDWVSSHEQYGRNR